MSDINNDINNDINSGKEVTVHEKNVNFNGWNGSGYIIINPDIGAGTYLISGGANGAMFAVLGA